MALITVAGGLRMKIEKQKIFRFIIISYCIISCAWITNEIMDEKHPCEEARIEMIESIEEMKSILGL